MPSDMRAPGHRGSAFPTRAARAGGPAAEFITRLAVVLVIALALAPAIRDVTAGLTATLGQQWPFAMEHCRAPATPGCEPTQPNARLAIR